MNHINKILAISFLLSILFIGCKNKSEEQESVKTDLQESTVATVSGPIELRSVMLTSRDGLPDNSIREMYQDSKGFIWLSTLNGLSRYDGTNFITFRKQDGGITLMDNRVRYINEDSNGLLWVSTNSNSYSCYDLKRDCFVDFTGNGTYNKYKFSRMLQTDSTGVWLWSGDDGAMKIIYDDGNFESEYFGKERLGTEKVNFVYKKDESSVWIGTGKGLYVYADTTLTLIDGHYNFTTVGKWKDINYFFTEDGNLFAAHGEKLHKVGHINLAKDEESTGRFSLDDRLIFFTTSGSYSVDFKTDKITRNEGMWDIKNASVMSDNKGGRWIANKTGVLRYYDGKTMKTFQMMPENSVGFIDMERYHIVRDDRGLVWITTYGNGLFVYNTTTGTMQHFTAGNDTNSPIVSNYLQAILKDRSGGIWVSSEYGGLSRLFVMNEGITRIFPESPSRMDRSNTIRMVYRAENGDIKIGTRAGGVYTYSSDMSVLKNEQHYDVNIYGLSEDSDGNMLIGTREKGLYVGDRKYQHDDKPGSISSNRLFCMLKDNKGRIWIGSFGGGLNLAMKQKDGSYKFRNFSQNYYTKQEVRCLFQDNNGWIWLGTSGGLFVFNPDKLIKDPKAYYFYDSNNSSLLTEEIRYIMQDHTGKIWLATPGSGLTVCDNKNKDYSKLKFDNYNVDNGLVSNMVQAIVEDNKGTLWVPTEYGMSRFNPEANTFENYFFSQYTMGNVYSENSVLKLDNGKLLVGTNYGLVLIDPDMVQRSSTDVQVTYTDLKINGVSVRANDSDSPIEGALSYIDEINLENSQNTFTIELSTFDYSGADDVKYTYKLENYDQEWSTPSTSSYVSYKNLSPGTYYLHAKACNALGIWSDDTVMKIVVAPPFYLSVWAFLIYIILVIVIGYIVFRTVRNMNSLRNKIRLEESLTKYKLVFFTNISHEFRTPLTLIQGSLEKINKSGKFPKELSNSVKIMDKSTQRMLRLINQLLEFRKMQNNKLSLSLEKVNVIALLHDIFDSFIDSSESKAINYTFESKLTSYQMFVDKRHIDKIVYNLLSNAFKYTPSGGTIKLVADLDETETHIIIKVIDSGVGISEEKRKELFSRFMQSNYSGDSFGIGLHLTRELVNVHKGTIVYDENPGGGSIFTVTLSTDSSVYEEKDFLVPDNVLLKEEAQHQKEMEELVKEKENKAEEPKFVKPLNKRKVLVIEDDNDVRDFVCDELKPYFEVESASDGKEGLEKAKESDVDLVISDIMMPVMNGYEVTKHLRDDFNTSHIPVILLTALNTTESKMEGIESGADAYIPKPFSTQLLLTCVFKLIEQREKLREKFSNDLKSVRPALCSTEQDKLFADRMSRIMEHELSNAQFSVDKFAEMMNMGRTVFFRKVKGVTGYTPNEYIRIVRMKRAAELLLENQYTVSEISYKVGIDDPFYFSKCFKKQFGVPPSAYQKGDKSDEDMQNE